MYLESDGVKIPPWLVNHLYGGEMYHLKLFLKLMVTQLRISTSKSDS